MLRVWVVMLCAMLCVGAWPAGGVALHPENDAGSGRDAPRGVNGDPVWIESGRVYNGTQVPGLHTNDGQRYTMEGDWYAFEAEAGVVMDFRVSQTADCPDVYDDQGERLDADCYLDSGNVRIGATLATAGVYYVAVPVDATVYRFALGLGDPAPRPVDLEPEVPGTSVRAVEPPADACAETAEVPPTHGEGDESIENLTWAALKTGFRLAVAWDAPADADARLRYGLAGGDFYEIDVEGVGPHRVAVLDSLPVGEVLCFQVAVGSGADAVQGEWHAVSLRNAMTAYDAEAGAYSINLLALANEDLFGRDTIEGGLDVYAQKLWDATDGHIRAGRILLLGGDAEHHHSGLISCYMAFQVVPAGDTPACNQVVDVVFSHDNLPIAAGATYLDGIQDPEQAIWMNSLYETPTAPGIHLANGTHEVGSVLLHEVGHYAFAALDLYVGNETCWDPDLRISIMSNTRDATEFDGPNAPCPDADSIPDYVPSWTLIRERFSEVPERPTGPIEGPAGDGGAYVRTTYWAHPDLRGPAVPSLPQDDAGSGGDAPNTPVATLWMEPNTALAGELHAPLGDTWDWYAFNTSGPGDLAFYLRGVDRCFTLAQPGSKPGPTTCLVGTAVNPYTVHLDSGGVWVFGVRSWVATHQVGVAGGPYELSYTFSPDAS